MLDWSVIEAEDPHWRTRPRRLSNRDGKAEYDKSGPNPKGGNHSPERLRAAAFVVYHFYGWPTKLIADQFSVPAGTIHRWRRRYQWCSLSRWMKMEDKKPADLAPSGDLAEVAGVMHHARAGRIVGTTLSKQAQEGTLMGELADAAVEHERFKLEQSRRIRDGLTAIQERRDESEEEETVEDLKADLGVVDVLDKIQHRGGASGGVAKTLNDQVVDYLEWEP